MTKKSINFNLEVEHKGFEKFFAKLKNVLWLLLPFPVIFLFPQPLINVGEIKYIPVEKIVIVQAPPKPKKLPPKTKRSKTTKRNRSKPRKGESCT
jgi:hypothetical protein